jgi:LysM repeat protein
MDFKRLIVLSIILLLAVSLTACTRNLPTPESEAEAEAETAPTQEVPAAPTDDIGQTISLNLTQTAQAQMPQTTPAAPGETPAAPPDVTVPEASATAPVVQSPQPTSPPVDVPPVTVPTEYTLKGGEFPYCIARRFNVDPGELLRANGLSSSSVYYAGMNLKIPQSGRSFPGQRSLRSHPTTYTVLHGDTIYRVACYFGAVAPEQIAAANGLTEPYKLTAGQLLNIP